MSELGIIFTGIIVFDILLMLFLLGAVYIGLGVIRKGETPNRENPYYRNEKQGKTGAVKNPKKPFANTDEKIWERENE